MTEVIKNLADAKRLLAKLDAEKDGNKIAGLLVCLRDDFLSDEKDGIWQILSHPYSKIDSVSVMEWDPNASVTTGVTKAFKRWCKEIPVMTDRSFFLKFHESSTNEEGIADLREALQHPNNGVTSVSVDSIQRSLHICDLVLRPVLGNGYNCIKSLTLHGLQISDQEAAALSKGLTSPNCKIDDFRIECRHLSFRSAVSLLDGIAALSHVESFVWQASWEGTVSDENKAVIVARIACLLERPSNLITYLGVRAEFTQDQVSILASSLHNVNCRVEKLDLEFGSPKENVSLPLVIALRHPNNRVKSLRCELRGEATRVALGEWLADPNCKLEAIGPGIWSDAWDEDAALAVVEALQTSKFTPLRFLILGRQTSRIFRALTRFLRSPNNRLMALQLEPGGDINKDTLKGFFRALRASSVIGYVGGKIPASLHRFSKAFGSPFFRVLVTLLAVKHIPRLGKSTAFRCVPVQDVILRISETLGWPLDDMRLA